MSHAAVKSHFVDGDTKLLELLYSPKLTFVQAILFDRGTHVVMEYALFFRKCVKSSNPVLLFGVTRVS